MPNFHEPIRRDRSRRGGGVAIYISIKLGFKRRQDLESRNAENLFIEIYGHGTSFLLGTAYIPPGRRDLWDECIDDLSNTVSSINSGIIVTGDFNINLLSPQSLYATHDIQSTGLKQIITEPTRITQTSATLIDYILINNQIKTDKCGVLAENLSDHCPIYISINITHSKVTTYKRHVFYYEQGDHVGLSNALSQTNWDQLISNEIGIDTSSNNFTEHLQNIVKEFIPNQTVTIRPKDPPWFNAKIRSMLRKRNRLFKYFKKYQTEASRQRYTSFRNQVKTCIRKAKQNNITSVSNSIVNHKFGSNQWWTIIKKMIKPEQLNFIPPLKHPTDNTIRTNEKDKAELLNDYFVSISTVDQRNVPLLATKTQHTFEMITVSEHDVILALNEISQNKACGPDLVSPLILKQHRKVLAKPLSKLFNISLNTGIYPENWKLSNVIPIHKKGDRSLTSNYRPISLTSHIGKTFERIIHKYILQYMNENNLIYSHQSGFLPNHCTLYQLIEIYNTVVSNMDDGLSTRFVFCDMSKAFDKVWHEALLIKLRSYGVTGNLLRWIANYLNNRMQRVIVNNNTSEYKTVRAGVPQGSVLGPLLFLIYINDLPDYLNCSTRIYADDTSLFISYRSEDELMSINSLNNDLTKLHTWTNDWQMNLNAAKTECVTFTRRQLNNFPLYLNNVELAEHDNHRHLGVILQSNGKWDLYMDYIVQTANKRISVLRKFKYILSRKVLNTLYLTYIRPILEYCSPLWDNCTEFQSLQLEKIQHEAARIVTGLPRYCSNDKILLETGWDKLQTRRQHQKLTTMYKIVNNLAPPYLHETLPPLVGEQNPYNVRNAHNFRPYVTNTTLLRNSFFPSMALEWNKLNTNIKESPSVNCFKNRLKKVKIIPKYYWSGERKPSVILCQIRNGCSQLNYDLFRSNLTPTSLCSCGIEPETPEHFFLNCPLYNEIRGDITDMMTAHSLNFEALILGSSNLNSDNNSVLLSHVQTYIKHSKRFS